MRTGPLRGGRGPACGLYPLRQMRESRPMEAVSLPEIGVQVQEQKCAGCGECVSLCPKGVLKLTARSGAPTALPQERLDRIYL